MLESSLVKDSRHAVSLFGTNRGRNHHLGSQAAAYMCIDHLEIGQAKIGST